MEHHDLNQVSKVKVIKNTTTITEANDMYFGGVCVTGYESELFSYGDKRRGDANWKN